MSNNQYVFLNGLEGRECWTDEREEIVSDKREGYGGKFSPLVFLMGVSEWKKERKQERKKV